MAPGRGKSRPDGAPSARAGAAPIFISPREIAAYRDDVLAEGLEKALRIWSGQRGRDPIPVEPLLPTKVRERLFPSSPAQIARIMRRRRKGVLVSPLGTVKGKKPRPSLPIDDLVEAMILAPEGYVSVLGPEKLPAAFGGVFGAYYVAHLGICNAVEKASAAPPLAKEVREYDRFLKTKARNLAKCAGRLRASVASLDAAPFMEFGMAAGAVVQSARSLLADIEAEAESLAARARDLPVESDKRHSWTIEFALDLCFTWRQLTGQPPAWRGDFLNFIATAYQSASGSTEPRSWERPVKAAIAAWKREQQQARRDRDAAVLAELVRLSRDEER